MVGFHGKLRTGGVLEGRDNHIRNLKHLCDTLQIHPSTLISGETPDAVFQLGDDLVRKFVKLHEQGKSTIKISKKYKKILADGGEKKENYLENMRYRIVQPRNNFSRAFGYQYPENYSPTSAQSVKRNHGNYADVMLTLEQIEQAKKWLIENHGLDSDIFRWFMFGIESCARKKAILHAKNTYAKVDFLEKPAYVLSVYESKVKHLQKGIYKKYITIPETQESIDAVAKRSPYLIEDRSDKAIKELYKILKKLYCYLGVDKKWLAYHDDLESGYCILHPTHALRHLGCQLWFLRLGPSAVLLVAKMGGWNTLDEPIASYGGMSDERLLAEIGKAWQLGAYSR